MNDAPASESGDRFMVEALALARAASEAGEVPVGAVVVRDDTIIGRGSNAPIGRNDPTAHAEILAIRDAARETGNYRLTGAILYCTLEPCMMCLGAAIHARIGQIVYGARDPKVGATDRLGPLCSSGAVFNHSLEVRGGARAGEAAALMRSFFRERRSDSGDGEVPKWS